MNNKGDEMMLLAEDILNVIVTKYENILKNNLIGIYLHDSMAMNCFNIDISNIDFLIVIEKKIIKTINLLIRRFIESVNKFV